jgi:proliferating cell nuclear antigen
MLSTMSTLMSVPQVSNNSSNYVLGLSLQAMDGSHVALVSLNLTMEGFEHYRADTSMVLGVNVALLSKVMKLADPSDSITLMAED